MRAFLMIFAAIATLGWAMVTPAGAKPGDPVPTAGKPAADNKDDDAETETKACLYRDGKYGPGAVICVGPGFGEKCGSDFAWSDADGGSVGKLCANAPFANPGAPAAGSIFLSHCLYHGQEYAPGAVICVGPGFGQTCQSSGSWSAPADKAAAADNVNYKFVCANAQIAAPAPASASITTTAGLCTYHDVHYAVGAVICVAPSYGQKCEAGGEWEVVTKQTPEFLRACEKAQIPAPTGASNGSSADSSKE